jgi:hypothetical protein
MNRFLDRRFPIAGNDVPAIERVSDNAGLSQARDNAPRDGLMKSISGKYDESCE